MGGGELALQVDGNWNADQWMEEPPWCPSRTPMPSLPVPACNRPLECSVWVKNLNDEDYLLYNLDLGLAGFIEQVYAPPQQGVTLAWIACENNNSKTR